MKKDLKVFSIGFIILLVFSAGVFYASSRMKHEKKVPEPKNESKSALSMKPGLRTDQRPIKQPNNKEKSNRSHTQNDWELIWSDEFDGVGLDTKKWTMEDWAADKNNELQYYSPNNVEVENGLLKLISREESYGGRSYTSGAIHSKDKFSFLYGKAEMRARLPKGQGMFPAFWMLTNKENTWLPEIDIMEMIGSNPKETWMVMHWLGDNKRLTSVSKSYKGEDFSKGFHVFGMEWTPDSISWFIDGVERFKTDQFIPQEEMYLYLNTAIGGDWPGSPDETTSFPAFFEVDYVRVYQKNGG